MAVNPQDYDVKALIVCFTKPTRMGKKFADEACFMESVINNPKFQEDLRGGKILGLLTHAGRALEKLDTTIPYTDNMALCPDLANVMVDIEREGDSIYAYLKLQGPKAEDVRRMIKSGMDLGVSMSTQCDRYATESHHIKNLLGVDFTLDPAFIGTEISEVNFSFCTSNKEMYHNFSGSIVGFSDNFSLMQRVKDAQLVPAESLRKIIMETIQYLKSMKQKDIVGRRREIIIDWVNDPIYNWITRAFEQDGKQLNLQFGLNIQRYFSDKSRIPKINEMLNRVRNRRKASRGFYDKRNQVEMQAAMNMLFEGIWEYIEKFSKKKVRNISEVKTDVK